MGGISRIDSNPTACLRLVRHGFGLYRFTRVGLMRRYRVEHVFQLCTWSGYEAYD